jgi:hypothetical protein
VTDQPIDDSAGLEDAIEVARRVDPNESGEPTLVRESAGTGSD